MNIRRAEYRGTVTVPASKSQTIRALLIAYMAGGKSVIRHPLHSSDTLSCINALKTLGAKVEEDENGTLNVDSSSLPVLQGPVTLDCGNSGTTTALLVPILALSSVPFTVTGDSQLKKRPFMPLLKALEDLGASASSENGCPPIRICGPVKGGSTTIECRSSQYLSGLLLALPLAECDSTVTCSLLYEKPYVKMTEEWLRKEDIRFSISQDMMVSHIKGGQKYRTIDEYVEGDFSSASFFFVLAAIQKTKITVSGLKRDTTQGDRRILEVLEKMGCRAEWNGNSVTVTGPEMLSGGDYDINDIPDALPSLAVAACFSREKTILRNVAQARIKETDRISVMKTELEKLGARIDETDDGLVIYGRGFLRGGSVCGHGDHRVIMALSVAGTATEEDTVIDSTESVSVTFPTFYELLEELRQ